MENQAWQVASNDRFTAAVLYAICVYECNAGAAFDTIDGSCSESAAAL